MAWVKGNPMAGNNKAREAWRAAASATGECLSINDLERLAENASLPDEKSTIHLAACPHCQTELAMLKNFESATPSHDEGAAVAWIAAQLARNPVKSSPQNAAAGRLAFWRSFFRSSYVVAALAVALIIIFGVSLYISEHQKPPQLSAGLSSSNSPEIMRSGSVRLIAPSGDLGQLPVSFSWDAYPGARSYRVELTEVDGTLVWKGTVDQNALSVKPDLKSMLHNGKPYLWQVTALDASGNAVASSSHERFRIGTADRR